MKTSAERKKKENLRSFVGSSLGCSEARGANQFRKKRRAMSVKFFELSKIYSRKIKCLRRNKKKERNFVFHHINPSLVLTSARHDPI